MNGLDQLYAIAQALNMPYDDVAQHCQEMCALSPLPAEQVCTYIYTQALGKRSLTEIRADFEQPVEALKRLGDTQRYLDTVVAYFEHGIYTKEEAQEALASWFTEKAQ